MQTRDCVTVSNSPKSPSCPLQVQIMLILKLSSYFKHSWLASRPVDRFLYGSGASDCLGPSLTKSTILGGSGGGGRMLHREIVNNCVPLDCIFKAVTLKIKWSMT